MADAPKYYILKDKVPVPCDFVEWAHWFETANRHVANDCIGDVRVSTVFLGLDHSWGYGPPLLFETMIFNGRKHTPAYGHMARCSTWEQALAQHAEAIALVHGTLN
jgi:hypothetical protein